MKFSIIVASLFFLLNASPVLCAQDTITLYGIIDDEENLITDRGQVYDLAETPKNDDLMLYKGKRLEIRGKIMEIDGRDVFMLFEFSPIKNKPVQPSN